MRQLHCSDKVHKQESTRRERLHSGEKIVAEAHPADVDLEPERVAAHEVALKPIPEAVHEVR